MSDDRDHRLAEAIYGEGHASPGDEAEAARLKAFREGLAGRLAEVQPPPGLRARLVAEARARAKARRSPWAVWAVRLAPVATVVLVVGVWVTVQPRFDRDETATPQQTAARAADEWAAPKPSAAPTGIAPEVPQVAAAGDAKPKDAVTTAPATGASTEPLDQAHAPTAKGSKAAEATAAAVVPGYVADTVTRERKETAATHETRARLKKELERNGILTTLGSGDGKGASLFGSGGLGDSDLSKAFGNSGLDRGIGEAYGGGLGALGAPAGGTVSGGSGRVGGLADIGGARPSDGTGELASATRAKPMAKAKADRAGAVGGEDLDEVAYRPAAPRRDEAQLELEEAGPAPAAQKAEARPAAAAARSGVAAAPAPAAEPVATIEADDLSAAQAEKVAAAEKKVEAPASPGPQPAASGGYAPPAAAKPSPEVSCRLLEQLLLRAATTALRVDLSLKLAECRKRAGAPGLAKKLLEDLLDDTTLSAAERDLVTDALRGL